MLMKAHIKTASPSGFMALSACVISAVLLILLLTGHYNFSIPYYLFWHTLVQGIGILLAAQIFTLVLSIYRRGLPVNIIILGLMFFGVACFDFSHALVYDNLVQISPTDPREQSIYFWLIAKLLNAIGLLLICFFSWNKRFQHRYFKPVFVLFLSLIVLIHWFIFYRASQLPKIDILYIGQLSFEHATEGLLFVLYGLTALVLYRQYRQPHLRLPSGYFVAALLFSFSEGLSLLNSERSEGLHLISHLYRIAATYILYRAVFNEVVLRPYTLLKTSRQKLAATLHASPDIIFEIDDQGQFLAVYSKEPTEAVFTERLFLHKTLAQVLEPEYLDIAWESLREAREHGLSRGKTIQIKLPTYEPQWFELSVSYLRAEGQNNHRFIIIAHDISKRIKENKRLLLLSHAVDQNPSAIYILNKDFHIEFINNTFSRLTGYKANYILGKPPYEFCDHETPHALMAHIHQHISQGRIWQGEIKRISRTKRRYTADVSIYPITDAEGQISNYLVIESDISQNKAILEQLQKISNFDRLTGLPNNDRLFELLNHLLATNVSIAVLWINLDQFKNINDALGHHVGDQVLKEVSDRFSNILRPQDVLARPGSDNFVMLLPGAQHGVASAQAQKIIDALAEPLKTPNQPIVLTASTGIAFYPQDSNDASSLLAQAETAMHRIKKENRGDFCYFHLEMRQETAHRLALDMALKQALDNQEMYLVFQPQIHLDSGQLIGTEVLLRWHPPLWGEISPAEFIPIAEESGDIIAIGDWVLHNAIRQIKKWQAQGLPVPQVSVNISAKQLEQPNFVTKVVQMLAQYQLPPEHIEFELTEAVAMKNPEYSALRMQELSAARIKVSIDDFGTGYSSLSYLKRFDIHTIKIDRSFVKDIVHNNDDQAIVNAIIYMAHQLGMRTVAEGVETQAQLDYLRSRRCYAAQGYYFTRALTSAELEHYLKNQQAST